MIICWKKYILLSPRSLICARTSSWCLHNSTQCAEEIEQHPCILWMLWGIKPDWNRTEKLNMPCPQKELPLLEKNGDVKICHDLVAGSWKSHMFSVERNMALFVLACHALSLDCLLAQPPYFPCSTSHQCWFLTPALVNYPLLVPVIYGLVFAVLCCFLVLHTMPYPYDYLVSWCLLFA